MNSSYPEAPHEHSIRDPYIANIVGWTAERAYFSLQDDSANSERSLESLRAEADHIGLQAGVEHLKEIRNSLASQEIGLAAKHATLADLESFAHENQYNVEQLRRWWGALARRQKDYFDGDTIVVTHELVVAIPDTYTLSYRAAQFFEDFLTA
ncbi:MAG TPA: hypothetical protein VGE34_04210 [Candidatus Saccharimonadales bacterium]